MSLGPVVASSRLSKYKVVRSKDLSKGSGPHTVHGSRLKVHQHCPGHVLAPRCLVVIDIDPLKLKLGGTSIRSSWVNTVLIRNDFPELKKYLSDYTKK